MGGATDVLIQNPRELMNATTAMQHDEHDGTMLMMDNYKRFIVSIVDIVDIVTRPSARLRRSAARLGHARKANREAST
jgi:hypothetical protein